VNEACRGSPPKTKKPLGRPKTDRGPRESFLYDVTNLIVYVPEEVEIFGQKTSQRSLR